MKHLMFLILVSFPLVGQTAPAPFPVFLKAGFSTVLEFEESPLRVVLGNSQAFQVEKLEQSIVVRNLVPYAVGNMFVYFKSKEPQLFILTASEDAEPTYYKKFETQQMPKPITTTKQSLRLARGIRATKIQFDKKKDYLVLEVEISADSQAVIRPNWDLVRLTYKSSAIAPNKLWSSRKEIQRDSKVASRFVFFKPNLPRVLEGVTLVVPLIDKEEPLKANIRKRL